MPEPARIPIGTWPTPVRKMEETSELVGVPVWVKLEEACGAWGGNKVRKLEHILGRARQDGMRKLVGFGAGTSNWTSALAYHGVNEGFEVEVWLSDDAVPPHLRALYRKLGVAVIETSRPRWMLELLSGRVRRQGGDTRYLPLGGSGAEGDHGSLQTGVEIAEAVRSGEIPRPSRIFVATGTAGTAAGVAVGAALANLTVPVVCVRVTARPYGTRRLVGKRVASLQQRVGLDRPSSCPLLADDGYFAPGYAKPNPASLEAALIARRDGVELDQTYAAKAFASLVAAARRSESGPYLFVHTSPGPTPVGP